MKLVMDLVRARNLEWYGIFDCDVWLYIDAGGELQHGGKGEVSDGHLTQLGYMWKAFNTWIACSSLSYVSFALLIQSQVFLLFAPCTHHTPPCSQSWLANELNTWAMHPILSCILYFSIYPMFLISFILLFSFIFLLLENNIFFIYFFNWWYNSS